MNEAAAASETTALAPATAAPIALAHNEPMPTALRMYLDEALYQRVTSIAARMSKADGITPRHLIAKPEACFAVATRAITWKLDVFAVAMATYQTPGGQIGFYGSLVQAIIENSGRLEPNSGGVRFEHYGDWSKVQGKFAIIEKQKDDGKKTTYAAPRWTDDDARTGKPTDQVKYPVAQSCGVRVMARLRGEAKDRILDFDLIQAQPRNSTLWATDPMTQICYTAVRRFGNVVVPALLMGVPFDPVDSFAPAAEIDVTPADAGPIGMPSAKSEPAAPIDVDQATGETSAPVREAAEPEKAQPAGTETQKPEGLGKKASEAQRRMIIDIAKRGGLSVAQLDEHLVEKFSMGIDELPMGLVSEATQLVRNLTTPAAAK